MSLPSSSWALFANVLSDLLAAEGRASKKPWRAGSEGRALVPLTEAPDFWRKYVGRRGAVVGVATFGESAPAKDLYAHFGLTAAHVADAVRGVLAA